MTARADLTRMHAQIVEKAGPLVADLTIKYALAIAALEEIAEIGQGRVKTLAVDALAIASFTSTVRTVLDDPRGRASGGTPPDPV